MCIAAVLLGISSDIESYGQLSLRKKELITHLILWQRHPDDLVLSPDEDPRRWEPQWIPLRQRFQEELTREIAAGLCIPPIRLKTLFLYERMPAPALIAENRVHIASGAETIFTPIHAIVAVAIHPILHPRLLY